MKKQIAELDKKNIQLRDVRTHEETLTREKEQEARLMELKVKEIKRLQNLQQNEIK
jgi:hypothetical protein